MLRLNAVAAAGADVEKEQPLSHALTFEYGSSFSKRCSRVFKCRSFVFVGMLAWCWPPLGFFSVLSSAWQQDSGTLLSGWR